jgi:hypothetical protein
MFFFLFMVVVLVGVHWQLFQRWSMDSDVVEFFELLYSVYRNFWILYLCEIISTTEHTISASQRM